MILKRYGTQLHSVDPNFDARVMNEIGFQRSHAFSIATAEFEQQYEHVRTHELVATAEGRVQHEAKEALLASLRDQIEQLESGLNEGDVLVLESEQGKDYPKMREKVTGFVEQGENKLHFERTVDPPLKIGHYTQRKR